MMITIDHTLLLIGAVNASFCLDTLVIMLKEMCATKFDSCLIVHQLFFIFKEKVVYI